MNDAGFQAFVELVTLMCEDAVSVTSTSSGWARDVEIVASATDVRRLVGERAMTFRGLTGVLRAIGIGTGASYELMPVTARKGTESHSFRRFVENPNWPREQVERIVTTVCNAAFPNAVQAVTLTDRTEGDAPFTVVEVRLLTKLRRPAEIFVEALDRVLRLVGIRQGRMLHAKLVLA